MTSKQAKAAVPISVLRVKPAPGMAQEARDMTGDCFVGLGLGTSPSPYGDDAATLDHQPFSQ